MSAAGAAGNSSSDRIAPAEPWPSTPPHPEVFRRYQADHHAGRDAPRQPGSLVSRRKNNALIEDVVSWHRPLAGPTAQIARLQPRPTPRGEGPASVRPRASATPTNKTQSRHSLRWQANLRLLAQAGPACNSRHGGSPTSESSATHSDAPPAAALAAGLEQQAALPCKITDTGDLASRQTHQRTRAKGMADPAAPAWSENGNRKEIPALPQHRPQLSHQFGSGRRSGSWRGGDLSGRTHSPPAAAGPSTEDVHRQPWRGTTPGGKRPENR